MNFDDAVAAHIKWKVQLMQFVDGISTENIKSTTVCKDNLCDLGKWIHGDAIKYKSLPHYQKVLTKHANFHIHAAEVVKNIERNDRPAAKSALSGAFAIASKETVAALMELKREVAKAPWPASASANQCGSVSNPGAPLDAIEAASHRRG